MHIDISFPGLNSLRIAYDGLHFPSRKRYLVPLGSIIQGITKIPLLNSSALLLSILPRAITSWKSF